MTGYPKNFPGQIQIGVIAGGDVTDPAQDHSCNQRVFSPLEHSPDGVKIQHLAMSPMAHSPTNHSQQSFPGCLDPGTLVYVLKNTGSNQVTILGQANDLHNSSTNRIEGNIDLFNNPVVNELFKRTIEIQIPPDIEEKTEKGAKVKKIKEKGKDHSHDLLKGLPTHGSLFGMSGFRIPEVKQVPTALQHFQALLTEDMMDNMGGDMMSLGKMFQGLMSQSSGGIASGIGIGAGVPTMMDNVLSGMTPQMRDAMMSMSVLVQGMEAAGNVGSYMTSARVDKQTYLTNAQELLGQVTTIDDMMSAMHQLQWDTSLFGLDKIKPLSYVVDTAYGNTIDQMVYANGYISLGTSKEAQNNQNIFAQTMTTSGGSPSATGGAGGGSMFGNQGGNLIDMLKRCSPEAEKKMKQVLEKVNTSGDAKKITGIVEALMKGQNPVMSQLFKG